MACLLPAGQGFLTRISLSPMHFDSKLLYPIWPALLGTSTCDDANSNETNEGARSSPGDEQKSEVNDRGYFRVVGLLTRSRAAGIFSNMEFTPDSQEDQCASPASGYLPR